VQGDWGLGIVNARLVFPCVFLSFCLSVCLWVLRYGQLWKLKVILRETEHDLPWCSPLVGDDGQSIGNEDVFRNTRRRR
jgi:hypothetical protein